MESLDILLIILTTFTVIIICGICISKSQIGNERVLRFNTVTPLHFESDYQMEESESSTKTQREINGPVPRIIISCL